VKLLFNLEIVEGSRIRARPSNWLAALPRAQQIEAVSEFLRWAETEARDNPDPGARAEAEIGIATAREFVEQLGTLPGPIITGRIPHE